MKQHLVQHLDWEKTSFDDFPRLKKQECHLWWLPLELDSERYTLTESWLNAHQRDKLSRRSTPESKKRYLAGRYYLLRLLSGYTGLKESALTFSYTRLNKPYLNHSQALHFNFTDTVADGQAHCALLFARDQAVGVDLELLNRTGNFELIAQRRFSDNEQQAVKNINADIDPNSFLALWTRKEASGKATGQGINFAMQNRDLYLDGRLPLNFYDENCQPWRLHQYRFGEDLIGCAVHYSHQEFSFRGFNHVDDST